MLEAHDAISKCKKYIFTDNLSWLVHTVRDICSTEEPPMMNHGFKFECTRSAAKFNHKLLKKFNYNLGDLIKVHPGSILHMGVEFRPVQKLQKVLGFNNDWPFIRSVLEEGASYPFKDDVFTPHDLKKEVAFMIERGNHKSTEPKEHRKFLDQAYTKEVLHG